MEIKVPIVNAFVDGNFGGNPAAVVLNADVYTRNQKQKIVAGIGVSETAFVSPSTVADYKLESECFSTLHFWSRICHNYTQISYRPLICE